MDDTEFRRSAVYEARRMLADAVTVLDRARGALLRLPNPTSEDRAAINDIEDAKMDVANIHIWESGDEIE